MLVLATLFALASIAHPLARWQVQASPLRAKGAAKRHAVNGSHGARARGALANARRRDADGGAGGSTAFLHIGPHKTGSTSLQTALLGPLRGPLLELDQIDIPLGVPGRRRGHKNHANLAGAVEAIARARTHGRTASKTARATWRWTRTWLSAALARNPKTARVLLASEGFASVPPDGVALLLQSLSVAGFARAHVIITYRRLYERLPSVHSQLFLQSAARGGSEYAPLVDWLEGTSAVRQRAMSGCFNQTARLRDTYTRHAAPHLPTHVSIINLHSVPSRAGAADSSLIRAMVCEHMQAAGTCAKLATIAAAAARANVRSRSVARFKDLAWAAAQEQPQRGFSPEVVSGAAALLQRVHGGSATGTALARVPMRCVSEPVFGQMLRATEAEERILFGAAPPSLRSELERKKADGLFCSADSRAALLVPAVRSIVLTALDAAAAAAAAAGARPKAKRNFAA